MHLTYRKSCRVCGSTELTPAVDLGEQYIQGAFAKAGYPRPPERKMPMLLVRCDPTRDERACGLLQMAGSVPPEILYSTYWYRSGTNTTMREHLRGIALEAIELTGKGNATVLDIGCNDGTLLKCYPRTWERVGIDPSNAVETIGDGIAVIRDLFPSSELDVHMRGRKFDVITSIAMFYDLEEPVAFVQSIRDSLGPEGVWIFEMSYMPSMLRLTAYDTICHEHLEYYSLAAVEYILRRAGMRVFDAVLNDVNGGSIRCYATHKGNYGVKRTGALERLQELHLQEFELQLDTGVPYRRFQTDIDRHRDELIALLRSLRAEGRSIHVYGASTKGNTLLQFCGIDSGMIDVAAERNPEKYGARTLGTNIPIVSEAESRAMRPDYYLVLPWHFRKEILEREAATIAAGTGMVFPLPRVEIVRA